MNMKSTNPFLSSKSFQNTSRNAADTVLVEENMTVAGAINKSFILLFALLAAAFVSWYFINLGYNPLVFTIGGAIVGFILVLIAAFKPHTSPWVAPG